MEKIQLFIVSEKTGVVHNYEGKPEKIARLLYKDLKQDLKKLGDSGPYYIRTSPEFIKTCAIYRNKRFMVVGLEGENDAEKINEGCKKLSEFSPLYYMGVLCEWVGDVLKLKSTDSKEWKEKIKKLTK